MPYSRNPDKSIVPAKLRQRIMTMQDGDTCSITLTTEQLARNMFQAIRAFLIGHDTKVPKNEQIASSIITSRDGCKLTIQKVHRGILDMEL